jgi:hypothetical protein
MKIELESVWEAVAATAGFAGTVLAAIGREQIRIGMIWALTQLLQHLPWKNRRGSRHGRSLCPDKAHSTGAGMRAADISGRATWLRTDRRFPQKTC